MMFKDYTSHIIWIFRVFEKEILTGITRCPDVNISEFEHGLHDALHLYGNVLDLVETQVRDPAVKNTNLINRYYAFFGYEPDIKIIVGPGNEE